MSRPHNYSIFQDFIAKYLPQGFATIDRGDPWMQNMEKKLKSNKQGFYLTNLLTMQVHFVSESMTGLVGVKPEDFQLSSLLTRVHPEDFHRHSLARSMVVKRGYELLMKRDGISVHSTITRIRDASDNFTQHLFQVFSFFSESPSRTVYFLLVLTPLTSFKLEKHGYHNYIGENRAMFRYPDEELLKTGHVFSDREFEIIKLIARGLGSEQIADKLSLSVNTVNTHRRNILKKTKKSTTQDLVIELQERGIL
jgi:DNA-binding CsgD family transcriptional regulator